MRLWCVVQWQRVDVCVTDGHCSAPQGVNDNSSVALCRNMRVLSDPNDRYGVSVVIDALSGVTLSSGRYSSLCVDTSGALLWIGVGNTVIVSSGPNSAGHTLAGVKNRHRLTVACFCYGVAFDWHECSVLRFDADLAADSGV